MLLCAFLNYFCIPSYYYITQLYQQVSVWRTILVANEWTELQCTRKTDIRFTLFFLGFVLLGEAYFFIYCFVREVPVYVYR